MHPIFELADHVRICISGETGSVIGKAEYLEGGTQYSVHYKAADGCARTEWFYGHQLKHAEAPVE